MRTLNDLKYSGEPLTLIVSDPSYKPDVKALEESIKKNRELMKQARAVMKEKKQGIYSEVSAQ